MIIVINKINVKNTIIATLNISRKNVNLNAKPSIVKQNAILIASWLPIKQNAK
jgi:hypothetical protein